MREILIPLVRFMHCMVSILNEGWGGKGEKITITFTNVCVMGPGLTGIGRWCDGSLNKLNFYWGRLKPDPHSVYLYFNWLLQGFDTSNWKMIDNNCYDFCTWKMLICKFHFDWANMWDTAYVRAQREILVWSKAICMVYVYFNKLLKGNAKIAALSCLTWIFPSVYHP